MQPTGTYLSLIIIICHQQQQHQMQFNGINRPKPHSNRTDSQARFNIDHLDENAIRKQISIRKGERADDSQYQLGDLAQLLEKVEQSKSKNKNDLNLNLCCSIRQFSIFGPSVYLYFEFMRKLLILFAVLSILSIIPMAYNAAKGSAYSNDAYGVTAALASTTIGSHTSSQSLQYDAKVVNLVILTLNILALFAFWLYWKKFTLEESNRIEQELQLSNYGAIIVETNQNTFDELELAAFLENFGKVEEIQKIVDIKNVLYLGKEIVQLIKDNKLLDYIKRSNQDRNEQLSNKISQNQHRIEQLKVQLIEQLKIIKGSEQVILRYFVKFSSHEALQYILATFNEYEGCCAKRIPDQLLINNKKITVVRQQCQPYEIYWENQSVTWKQSFIPQVLLLVSVNIFVIVGLIMIALILGSARPVYYIPSLASNTYPLETIAANGNQTFVDSWCLSTQPSPQNRALCSPVYDLYHVRIVIYIAIAFLLVIIKVVVKHIILFFKPYLRFRDKVEQSKEIIMHLFINYTIITILITLCLQTNLFSSAMINIFIACVQDPKIKQNLTSLLVYSDYTSQWYLQYGFQLILNFFVMAVLPHCLTPLTQKILNKIKHYNASKQQLHILMSKQIELRTFELEDHYASMFCILCAGLFFAGSMPIMIPLVFITLLAKFYITKYLFLHLSQPPIITDRTLANKIPPIFLFIITGYMLNSIWALGVESIFISQNNLFEDRGINAESNAHNPFEALLVFLKRLFNTWQPAMVYIIGIIAISIRKILLKVYLNFTKQNKKSQNHPSGPSTGGQLIISRAQANLEVDQQAQAHRSSYKQQINREYLVVLDYIHSLNY